MRPRGFERAGDAGHAVWEGCQIRLQTRESHGRFCAVADAGHVVAHSPVFPLKPAKGASGLRAPVALRALVDQLAEAGWQQSGSGAKPWDLRFERRVAAPSLFAPTRP